MTYYPLMDVYVTSQKSNKISITNAERIGVMTDYIYQALHTKKKDIYYLQSVTGVNCRDEVVLHISQTVETLNTFVNTPYTTTSVKIYVRKVIPKKYLNEVIKISSSLIGTGSITNNGQHTNFFYGVNRNFFFRHYLVDKQPVLHFLSSVFSSSMVYFILFFINRYDAFKGFDLINDYNEVIKAILKDSPSLFCNNPEDHKRIGIFTAFAYYLLMRRKVSRTLLANTKESSYGLVSDMEQFAIRNMTTFAKFLEKYKVNYLDEIPMAQKFRGLFPTWEHAVKYYNKEVKGKTIW